MKNDKKFLETSFSVWVSFPTQTYKTPIAMDHSIENIKEENKQTKCNKFEEPALKHIFEVSKKSI